MQPQTAQTRMANIGPTRRSHTPEATRESAQASALCSTVVFAPSFLTVAIYVICCRHFDDGYAAALVIIAAVLVGEGMTVGLLIAWRKRLAMFSTVAGWIVAVIGAMFILFVAAVNLGILRG